MIFPPVVERLFRGLGNAAREISQPLDVLLGFIVSPLPRRYWGGASGTGILLSSLVQIGICASGLSNAYSVFSHKISEELAETTIEVAKRAEAGSVEAAPAMAFGAITPFAFFAVSVSGRFVAYGVVSGVIRVLGQASGHPCGDPILTFADEIVWDTGRSLGSTVRRVVSRDRRRG